MKTAKFAWLALGLTVAAITANAESETAIRSDNDRAARVLSGDRDGYSWRDLSGRRFNFTDGSQIRGDRIRGDGDRTPSRPAAAVATPRSAVAAPEIDPASAASGLTLLLGGIAVLRSRRKPAARG